MPDLLEILGYGPFTGYCGYLGDDAQKHKKKLNNKLLCIGYYKLGVQGYDGNSCFNGYLGYLGYLGHQSHGYASPPWAIGL